MNNDIDDDSAAKHSDFHTDPPGDPLRVAKVRSHLGCGCRPPSVQALHFAPDELHAHLVMALLRYLLRCFRRSGTFTVRSNLEPTRMRWKSDEVCAHDKSEKQDVNMYYTCSRCVREGDNWCQCQHQNPVVLRQWRGGIIALIATMPVLVQPSDSESLKRQASPSHEKKKLQRIEHVSVVVHGEKATKRCNSGQTLTTSQDNEAVRSCRVFSNTDGPSPTVPAAVVHVT